jgi:hypothetical protein
MKRVWNYVVTMWQPATMMLLGGVVIAMLFAFRLSSLVPGTAQVETTTRDANLSLQSIVDNPINAPYKAARFVARHIHNSIVAERLVSGLIAGASIILFYLVVRHLCGRYAAGLATLMYATSSSLLTHGRLADPNILLLVLLVLIASGYHLRFNKHRARSWLYAAVIFSLALYVPTMIYFIAGGMIWQYKAVRRDQVRPSASIAIICSLIVVVLVAPLIYGFIRSPGLWHEYFGIPAAWPSPWGLLKAIAAVPFGVIALAPENPLYRLGRQPTLDVFAAIMFVLGGYQLVKRYKLDRLVLLVGIFIIATLTTALSGNYENSFILLPFLYICVAAGIGLLLEEWRKIFPLNPLARGVASIVMALAVLISVNFQTWRYFVAWPHNAVTKTVFTKR